MVAHGALLSPMAHANVTPPLKRGQPPPPPIHRLYCIVRLRLVERAHKRLCAHV